MNFTERMKNHYQGKTNAAINQHNFLKEKIESIIELSQKRGGGIVLAPSSSILNGTPKKNIYTFLNILRNIVKRFLMIRRVLLWV